MLERSASRVLRGCVRTDFFQHRPRATPDNNCALCVHSIYSRAYILAELRAVLSHTRVVRDAARLCTQSIERDTRAHHVCVYACGRAGASKIADENHRRSAIQHAQLTTHNIYGVKKKNARCTHAFTLIELRVLGKCLWLVPKCKRKRLCMHTAHTHSAES